MCVIQQYDVGTKMTPEQSKAMIAIGTLVGIIFLVILLFDLANIYLIFRQKMQRKALLIAFYFLATISNAALLVSTSLYLIEDSKYRNENYPKLQGTFLNDLPDQSIQLAYFTILMIGAVQYLSICELTVHVGNLNSLKANRSLLQAQRVIATMVTFACLLCYLITVTLMLGGKDSYKKCRSAYMFAELSQSFLGFFITVCLCTGVYNLTTVMKHFRAQQYSHVINQLYYMYGFLAVAYMMLSTYQLSWFVLNQQKHKFNTPFARYLTEACIPVVVSSLVIVTILIVHRQSFQNPFAVGRGQKSSVMQSAVLSDSVVYTDDSMAQNISSNDDFDRLGASFSAKVSLGSATSFSKGSQNAGSQTCSKAS